MKRFGPVLLGWLYRLAQAVWLGGILMLGAIAAPAVFQTAKAQGDKHTGTPLYDFAGLAASAIFGRLNGACVAAGAVMLVTGAALGSLLRWPRIEVRLRAALTALATATALWLHFGYYPRMIALRDAHQMEAFDAMHRAYRSWVLLEALFLFGVLAVDAWNQSRREIGDGVGE